MVSGLIGGWGLLNLGGGTHLAIHWSTALRSHEAIIQPMAIIDPHPSPLRRLKFLSQRAAGRSDERLKSNNGTGRKQSEDCRRYEP